MPENHTKNRPQTQTQTKLTARYEKPYQNRTVKRKTAHYGTVSRKKKINEFKGKINPSHIVAQGLCATPSCRRGFQPRLVAAYLINSTMKLQTHNPGESCRIPHAYSAKGIHTVDFLIWKSLIPVNAKKAFIPLIWQILVQTKIARN